MIGNDQDAFYYIEVAMPRRWFKRQTPLILKLDVNGDLLWVSDGRDRDWSSRLIAYLYSKSLLSSADRNVWHDFVKVEPVLPRRLTDQHATYRDGYGRLLREQASLSFTNSIFKAGVGMEVTTEQPRAILMFRRPDGERTMYGFDGRIIDHGPIDGASPAAA